MIRKAIIVILATLTVLSLFLGLQSCVRPIHLDLSGGEDQWFWVHIAYGAVTVSYADGRLPSSAERLHGRVIDACYGRIHRLQALASAEGEEMRASSLPAHKIGHPRQDRRAKALHGDLPESAAQFRQLIGEVRRTAALSMALRLYGEAFRADVSRTPRAEALVHCSFWALFLLFVVYPATAFVRGPLRRHRRRKKGLCLKCGYNLTGNVTGICPECGHKI